MGNMANNTANDAENNSDGGLDEELHLEPSHPNPAYGVTTITWQQPTSGDVSLVLYDALGREVAQIAHGYYSAGRHAITLITRDLPAGVYAYRITTSGTTRLQRLVVMK